MFEPLKSGTFNSAIELIRQHPKGCLIESFIRVEYGEQYLHAAWDAFYDINEYHKINYETEITMLNGFFSMLMEEVYLECVDLPLCL